MPNQMDEGYYDQKKEFACEGLKDAIFETESVLALIKSARYSMPGTVDAKQVHERLQYANSLIRNARRDFEKARWASTKTDLEFDKWLQSEMFEDLIQP